MSERPSSSRKSRTTRATPARRPVRRAAGLPALVRAAVEAARAKKAFDLVVLDLRKSGAFTDYFVICSGANPRQVQTIADAVEEKLRSRRERPSVVEGYARAEWVLLDYFDFVVHVFSRQARDFYALERLWGSAIRVEAGGESGPR